MPFMLSRERDSRRAAVVLLQAARVFREYREARLEANALALCWHHASRQVYWREPVGFLSVVPERRGQLIPGVRFPVRTGEQARFVMRLLREGEVGDAGRVMARDKVVFHRQWFLWQPEAMPVMEEEPGTMTMYKECVGCGRPSMPHAPLDYLCVDCRRNRDQVAHFHTGQLPTSDRFRTKTKMLAP